MDDYNARYQRAKRKVNALKGFYNHVKIFVLINGLLYLGRSGVLDFFAADGTSLPSYYFAWLDLNILVWGGALVIHGIIVYHNKLPWLKNWEARQIQKFMEEDQDSSR